MVKNKSFLCLGVIYIIIAVLFVSYGILTFTDRNWYINQAYGNMIISFFIHTVPVLLFLIISLIQYLIYKKRNDNSMNFLKLFISISAIKFALCIVSFTLCDLDLVINLFKGAIFPEIFIMLMVAISIIISFVVEIYFVLSKIKKLD